MKNVLRALRYFRDDTGKMIFAGVLLLLACGANLLKPWPLAWIVDAVLGGKPQPGVPAWISSLPPATQLALGGFLVFLLHALQAVLAAGQNFLSIRTGLLGLARLRNELFQWLQRLSLRYHQGSNQGDVIYRVTWDSYAVQTLLQQGVFTLCQASLSLGLMVVVMAEVNGRLTLVSLAILPPLLLAINFFGRRMKQLSLEAHQGDSSVTTFYQQTIQALPLIQSYTREDSEAAGFAERAEDSLRKRTAQHGSEVLYWLVIGVLFGAGVAALTWMGAREVLEGRLTVGRLLIFLAYLSQWYEPINQLSHLGGTLADASAGLQRVFEILDAPIEVREPAQPRRVRADANASGDGLLVSGNLELRGVSFGYNPGKPVLSDVSFHLKAGETAALIGPSGAGKTTLLQLLPRFFDPTAGSVLLEGVDLREFSLKDLRSRVSLVLQEPILLAATVAENIAYGRAGASREDIEAAARAAHAHEFIERLPGKYEAALGEGGTRLSVGEKQRINLARAFLKDSPILLLDEPTSALDAESEALIVDSLGRLMRGRTTLLVAHRLATVRDVHKVIVLQDGRVTQMGAPAELLAQPGYFAHVTSLYSARM